MSVEFSHGYIVSNRTDPRATSALLIRSLTGTLWWLKAPKQYSSEATEYLDSSSSPSESPSKTFAAALAADLNAAVAAGTPQLTVVIHGLANLFNDVVSLYSVLGPGLQKYGRYQGLVIAFDWPSFGEYDSWADYGPSPWQYPPPESADPQTIRSNISASVASFTNFFQYLNKLTAQLKVRLNIIAHSEGNFMTMLGMGIMQGGPIDLTNVLLVAADINDGALLSGDSPAYTGLAKRMAGWTKNLVTVYYSSMDGILDIVQGTGWKTYHNSSYPGRLGFTGPKTYDTLLKNCVGVDCTPVIDQKNQRKIPQWPYSVYPHSAYFYIPQVLQDWSQTLSSTPPGQVVNRIAAGRQHYTMPFVTPPGVVRLRTQ